MEEKKSLTKSEVDETIKDLGDFVKVNYLQRFLKQADNFEIKKYILLQLSAVNENMGLLNEAVKNVATAADIAITFRDKIDLHMKECELYIKMRYFDMADNAYKKAIFNANTTEREKLKTQYPELYRMNAIIAENTGRKRVALEIYEKLYSLAKQDNLKQETRQKLLDLYLKLGRVKEYDRLKEKVEQPEFELDI